MYLGWIPDPALIQFSVHLKPDPVHFRANLQTAVHT